MNILVIDAKGGGMGKQLVSNIKQNFPDVTVMAVGTNASATLAMNKAGADISGTGENSVYGSCGWIKRGKACTDTVQSLRKCHRRSGQ